MIVDSGCGIGELERTLEHHAGLLRGGAVQVEDGQLLGAAGGDGTVRAMDPASDELERLQQGGPVPV
jgi:hypothetical protein